MHFQKWFQTYLVHEISGCPVQGMSCHLSTEPGTSKANQVSDMSVAYTFNECGGTNHILYIQKSIYNFIWQLVLDNIHFINTHKVNFFREMPPPWELHILDTSRWKILFSLGPMHCSRKSEVHQWWQQLSPRSLFKKLLSLFTFLEIIWL